MFSIIRSKTTFAATLCLATLAAISATPAGAATPADAQPTASRQVAQVFPRYVWAYNQYDLQNAIAIAQSQGMRPVGYPQFRYVPEAGGMAWMIYIVPAYPAY